MLLAFLTNCDKERACPDCLELTSKSILYIDSSGNNLLYGSQAIYNPDNIVITTGDGEIVDVWKDENTGTIVFDLENDATSYQINLSDTLMDILEFELAERKSESCCGNVIFSTQTKLNGQEIENNNLIVIIN
ncbi:hypothetical protein OA501_00305 [Flavobacteriaceae bacterium]|nr:hypothetical protein [Flavobacteriaceae bacterium]